MISLLLYESPVTHRHIPIYNTYRDHEEQGIVETSGPIHAVCPSAEDCGNTAGSYDVACLGPKAVLSCASLMNDKKIQLISVRRVSVPSDF